MSAEPRVILLVEDRAEDVEAARDALEALPGLTVVVAGSAFEAIQILDAGLRPRLVLLDLSLPFGDGLEVLAHVRATDSAPRLPVAILTASDDPGKIERAAELDAEVYALKPHDPDEHARAVAAIGYVWGVLDVLRS